MESKRMQKGRTGNEIRPILMYEKTLKKVN